MPSRQWFGESIIKFDSHLAEEDIAHAVCTRIPYVERQLGVRAHPIEDELVTPHWPHRVITLAAPLGLALAPSPAHLLEEPHNTVAVRRSIHKIGVELGLHKGHRKPAQRRREVIIYHKNCWFLSCSILL